MAPLFRDEDIAAVGVALAASQVLVAVEDELTAAEGGVPPAVVLTLAAAWTGSRKELILVVHLVRRRKKETRRGTPAAFTKSRTFAGRVGTPHVGVRRIARRRRNHSKMIIVSDHRELIGILHKRIHVLLRVLLVQFLLALILDDMQAENV